jgi:release factor glutamine methyltransferase
VKINDNTAGSVYKYCTRKLLEKYHPNEARIIAEELFSAFHGMSAAKLIAYAQSRMSESEILKYHFAIKNILGGMPLQYAVGRAHFYNRIFTVSPEVLIPRPETEELCEYILRQHSSQTPLQVLDACTGSGCIAITLAAENPNFQLSAFDISESALAIATYNAEKLQTKIHFFKADALNTSRILRLNLDVLVTNPPYVLHSELETLDKNVSTFEPHLALFVPDHDPLLFYKHLSDYALINLKQHGCFYAEIHEKYGPDIAELLVQKGFEKVQIHQDLSGKNRFVSGVKI